MTTDNPSFLRRHGRKLLSALAAISVVFILADTMGFTRLVKPAPEPADPLGELIARVEALEAAAAPTAAPEAAAQAQAPARARRPAQSPAAPAAAAAPGAPSAEPAEVPAAPRWGTTDLDRAIADFKPTAPNPFTTGDLK
jgi:hypothetical protein